MSYADKNRGGRGGGKFGKFANKPTHTVKPEEPLEYKNYKYLTKFVGPTGKIQSRRRTAFSGQNQRKLANAIKMARFLGLMPFVGSAGGGAAFPADGGRFTGRRS